MTRKRLPKAITRTSDDLREIAAAAAATASSKSAGKRKPPKVARSAPALPDDAAAEPATVAAAVPAIKEPPPAAAIQAEPQAPNRLSRARKIVTRYQAYAAMAGLMPVPAANVAAGIAVTMRMFKALSDLYGVPFKRERARSFVIGLMAGAVPAGLAAATATTLGLVIPGGALAGLAVSAGGAAAFTHRVGIILIERLESGAMSLDAVEHA